MLQPRNGEIPLILLAIKSAVSREIEVGSDYGFEITQFSSIWRLLLRRFHVRRRDARCAAAHLADDWRLVKPYRLLFSASKRAPPDAIASPRVLRKYKKRLRECASDPR